MANWAGVLPCLALVNVPSSAIDVLDIDLLFLDRLQHLSDVFALMGLETLRGGAWAKQQQGHIHSAIQRGQ